MECELAARGLERTTVEVLRALPELALGLAAVFLVVVVFLAAVLAAVFLGAAFLAAVVLGAAAFCLDGEQEWPAVNARQASLPWWRS